MQRLEVEVAYGTHRGTYQINCEPDTGVQMMNDLRDCFKPSANDIAFIDVKGRRIALRASTVVSIELLEGPDGS